MVTPMVLELLVSVGGNGAMWGLWQTPADEWLLRTLPLPSPASACSLPQVLITHKYHWLPAPSKDLPPGNLACSRGRRNVVSSVSMEKEDRFLNTGYRSYYNKGSFVLPDFSGPPPSSVFWENRLCLIRCTLESFLSSLLLCSLLSSSLLLVLAIMVIAVS